VKTIDTLGAGDVFHGAFTLAPAQGCEVAAALRFAAAAARLKCTRVGGSMAAPHRAEVETLLLARPFEFHQCGAGLKRAVAQQKVRKQLARVSVS
jgi:bifunctional ADP-heptose synthase (sugar kinase/adenylyltransferase)